MASTVSPVRSAARSRVWTFIVLTCVALMARAGYGLATGSIPGDASSLRFDDERWYWMIGESLHDGEGLVGEFGHRAERMPLYPAFLALFTGQENGVALARIAQWVLGALAAGCTYLLARQNCREVFAILGGLAVALDPALVGCASLLLTETLFVTALVGLWCVAWPLRRRECASWGRWIAVAALSAICIYIKESSLAFVVLLMMYFIAVRRDWRSMAGGAIVASVIVAALVPWAYRNQQVIGEWCWLTTRGGISLYDGVRPGASGASDLGDVKDQPEVRALDEAAWNEYFAQRAWQAIEDEPVRILGLVPIKLARTWSPILNAQEYQSPIIRAVFALWYIPLYVAALLGVIARRRDPSVWIGLLLPVIAICLVHGLYVGSVRYRLGALPMLMTLGVIGVAWLVDRKRGVAAPVEPADEL